MIASSSVYRLALAVAACILLIEGSRLHAQNAELPESIRLALIRYADLDPLAVTWTQTAETTPTGPEKPLVQQLAFHGGRIYVRREIQGRFSWPPRTGEFAFDRELFYAAHNLFYAGAPSNREPKDRPFLHKWLPKNDRPESSYFQDDYFRAAGIRLPTQTKDLVLPWHPRSELAALLLEGGRIKAVGPTHLDGRPLIRVQVAAHQRQYAFSLDPERGHAVRRLDIWDEAGHLLTRSECTEFEQLSGRLIWMPRHCRVEEHLSKEAQNKNIETLDVSTSALYVKSIQVNAFDVQPWPNDRFQLRCTTPGAYVNDASFPEIEGKEGVVYQIPADPQRVEEVIAARRALHQGWMSAEKRSRPLKVLFLILNGVCLAGFTFYFLARRRRKAGSR